MQDVSDNLNDCVINIAKRTVVKALETCDVD